MSENRVDVIRNADLIAYEIRGIKEQVRRYAAFAAAEIGQKLVEAKELVPHGEWGEWLSREVDYSQSTANNFMRIYATYGLNSQSLENLNYTQALALTALSEASREELMAEHDVSEMSTRQLQEEIKARQEAEQRVQEAEAKADAERIAREELEANQKALNDTIESLNAELKAAADAPVDEKASEKLQAQLEKAKKDLASAKAKSKELEAQLKAKPIDVPRIEIKEVVPDDITKELEQLRKREEELTAEAKQKEEEAAQQVAKLQEQLEKNNNTAAIRVKLCFESLTGNFKELMAAVGELKNEEQRAAIKERLAKLVEQARDAV